MRILMPVTIALLALTVGCGGDNPKPAANKVFEYPTLRLMAGDSEPADILAIHTALAERLVAISGAIGAVPASGRAYNLSGVTYADYSFSIKRVADSDDLTLARLVIEHLNREYGDNKYWKITQLVMAYDEMGNEIADHFLIMAQTKWR